jgi:hypothetical protein
MLTYGTTGTAPGTTVLTIPSGGPFGAVPSDFDFSRAHLNYQRFYHGWVGGGLGQSPEYADPAAMAAELEVHRARLAVQTAVADLEHTKASHTWLVIGGLVGILGLAVSVWSITRSV